GRFGDADVSGDLLAQATARDLDHDLALARGQRLEAFLERPEISFLLAARTIAREADLNGVEEILVAEWLGQELDGAALHRLHAHRNIAVPRDEDDRDIPVRRRQLALQIEAALTRQSDVEHQAGGAVRRGRSEKVGNGGKRLNIETERSQQPSDRG